MLSLDASDSHAGAPRVHDGFTPEAQLERHLARALLDPETTHWLFGALLVSKAFITEYELILGHHGPFLELCPRDRDGTPTLGVFTSHAHVPATEAMDAEVMAFAELLRALPPGSALCLNPGGSRQYSIAADEVDMLRRIVTE